MKDGSYIMKKNVRMKIVNIIGIAIIICCWGQIILTGLFRLNSGDMKIIKKPHSLWTFPFLDSVAVDDNDNFYVSNSGQDIIQVFDSEGKFLRRYDCNESLQYFYIDKNNLLHIIVGRYELTECICKNDTWECKDDVISDEETNHLEQLSEECTYYKGEKCTIWGKTIHIENGKKIKLQTPIFPLPEFILMPLGIFILGINNMIIKSSKKKRTVGKQ